MDTNSDEQFLVIEATIESNKQYSDKNHKKNGDKITILIENQKETNETLKLILAEMKIDKKNISKSSPAQRDTSTPLEPTTTVQNNRKIPPLEEGISDKIRGIWTLKHEIRSPKLYELLIKTELKGDTDMDLNNFFNHIKMCLNAVTRLREDLLPD